MNNELHKREQSQEHSKNNKNVHISSLEQEFRIIFEKTLIFHHQLGKTLLHTNEVEANNSIGLIKIDLVESNNLKLPVL